MPIPSIKEIIELVKTGATIEAREKIMELRMAALEFQEENLGLKTRVSALEAELAQKKKLSHMRGVYWLDGDPTPLCPKCYETGVKLIHLTGPIELAPHLKDHELWQCHVCHSDFSAKGGRVFIQHLNADRRHAATK